MRETSPRSKQYRAPHCNVQHHVILFPILSPPLSMVEVSLCSLCILAFSRHISRTQSFQRNRHVTFLALVALKLLVSLISRLVTCSARIVADKQTHRTTTVTLSAHARRGLITYTLRPRIKSALKSKSCGTQREYARAVQYSHMEYLHAHL